MNTGRGGVPRPICYQSRTAPMGAPGASGPATDPRDRPADLPRRVRPEGEGDG